MRNAVVLAAGKGTRMKSGLPKVMHKILGQPMIGHVLTHLNEVHTDKNIMVVGHGAQMIQDYLKDQVLFALQTEQKGTGHAVMQAIDQLDPTGDTVLLYGDCPCVQSETIEWLFESNKDQDLTVLTAFFFDPAKYGRVIRDKKGRIKKIVEYKDCTPNELKVKEINTGIYCFKNEALIKYISQLTNNNAQNEYYITDLIEIFLNQGLRVQAISVKDNEEVMGVNDRQDLLNAQRWIQKKINAKWIENGVTFLNPQSTYISLQTTFEEDVVLYPNVFLEGENHIGRNTTITSNSFIRNSRLGQNVTIDSSRITDTVIGNDVNVGPFAHLRNGCVIGNGNRIGNFVEMKNTIMGQDNRCAHLTYLGDTEVGDDVNFGCGVVTVNYDGHHKFKTKIGDHAFIGSNVNLIAPISVGTNGVIAAGSTVTEDVPDDAMAIARQRQVNKPDLGKKYIEKK
jgi:bifunctional UDP-N-acetylglucosamine pyrophosphorylase / glucosamine-1-phosphate N-acetyltransferase